MSQIKSFASICTAKSKNKNYSHFRHVEKEFEDNPSNLFGLANSLYDEVLYTQKQLGIQHLDEDRKPIYQVLLELNQSNNLKDLTHKIQKLKSPDLGPILRNLDFLKEKVYNLEQRLDQTKASDSLNKLQEVIEKSLKTGKSLLKETAQEIVAELRKSDLDSSTRLTSQLADKLVKFKGS